MIIYSIQCGPDPYNNYYSVYFVNKLLATKYLDKIKACHNGVDRVLLNSETEYEIERLYRYGLFNLGKGKVSIKWSLKEIEVKEE